ncbi:flocculation protein FLO11-like isoform X2 [Momordica charantia]|nr:flocculation protein FLO11-like isoform X2 [Momordica charantia]
MVDGSMNLSMATNRTDGGNLRRFSMGKASLSGIDDQISSRRSSTGSCHDFCKYGHKHSLETKARVPLLKRAMKKSLNGQNSDLVVAMPKKGKPPPVPVTKLKTSPDLGTCITGGIDVVKRVVPVNSPARRSPVEIVDMNESKKHTVPVNSPTRRNSIGIEIMNENKERVAPVTSPSRRSLVEIEVMNESKEQVVPVNSSSRQSPAEIEVMNESKKCVVPVNSSTRQSSLGTEVMNENKERVAAVTSPSRRSSVGVEVMNESKERVVPVNSSSRQSPVEIEVMNEGKKRVVPVNFSTRRSSLGPEVMNENKERVAAATSPSRRNSVKIEAMNESKGRVVPINSSSRQCPVDIEVVNESKKRVVPVNSSTRRISLGIEVMKENKERVAAVTSPSRRSPVKIEVMNESKERVVPINSSSRQCPVDIEVVNESKKRVVPVNSSTRRSSLVIEAMNENKERVAALASSSRQSPVEIEVINESKEQVVPVTSSSMQSPAETEVMNESKELVVPVNSPSRQNPSKIEVTKERKKPLVKAKTSPKTHKPKIHLTTKQVVFSPRKSANSPKQALINNGEVRVSKRLNSLLKPKTLKEKSMISSGSFGNIAVHRHDSSETGEGSRTPKRIGTRMAGNQVVKLDPKSIDAVGDSPAIKNKNTRVVSRVITQNKMRRAPTKEVQIVEPQEKTLYVINTETKNTNVMESDHNEKHGLNLRPKQPSSPYQSSSLANCSSLSPPKEDCSGTKSTRSKANATSSGLNKQGGIKIGRSPRMLQTKGKDSSSLSVSFKKGKAVDLHSENPSPTRLKFIRGRSFGDNEKSKDGQRTSFKKVVNKGISKDSIPSSEKVVLRHQNVQGKKDTQVLFNKVIAETAGKLVRNQKGKVKALVGAFEKVISLQDKKPS